MDTTTRVYSPLIIYSLQIFVHWILFAKNEYYIEDRENNPLYAISSSRSRVRDLVTFLLCLPYFKVSYQIEYIAGSGAIGTVDNANWCAHPYAVASDVC